MNRGAAALALAVVAACAAPIALPKSPLPAGGGIRIAAEPIPFGARLPANWSYAGGVRLTSRDTTRLHGLSDLVVGEDGRLLSISDEGDLLAGQITLDAQDRLTGVSHASLTALRGLDGQPLAGKSEGDAEGLAVLGDGSVLVSFERRDRVWRYDFDGGRPRAVPVPESPFPPNAGLEALSADPEAGPDAYVAGAESSGRTWSCRSAGGCIEGAAVLLPAGFELSGMRRLSGGRTAWLLRAVDLLHGFRAELRITDAGGRVLGQLQLTRPAPVDNFEGVAAVERADGQVRFYLLSDDNFLAMEQTLLLAFDWTPREIRNRP